MRRIVFIIICICCSCLAFGQSPLSLTDVMVYKSNGGLVSNDNWQQQEAQTIGIYKRSETRYYTAWGERQSFTLDYWTWRGEKYSSNSGSFIDTNNGMSIQLQYAGTKLNVCITNNSLTNYLVVKLDHLIPNYCKNEDEGITDNMIPTVGNNLRNSRYLKYDYALIPPTKKAYAEFNSLKGVDFLPVALPSKAIIQLMFYGAYSAMDPWDNITRYYDGKPLVDDEVKYFTLSGIDYSNLVGGFFNNMIGFESRYHFKVK